MLEITNYCQQNNHLLFSLRDATGVLVSLPEERASFDYDYDMFFFEDEPDYMFNTEEYFERIKETVTDALLSCNADPEEELVDVAIAEYLKFMGVI